MRVIHSLAWYFPESKAGTETYVSQLIHELGRIGVDSTVVAGRDGLESDSYVHEGVEVFRYPVNSNPKLDQIRGRRPYDGFEVFSDWLKTQRADIYHQHSFNGGCGIHHLRTAKSLGLKTVMTVHMPNCVCLRGTMMFRGQTACDGNIESNRCGTCWGMSRGLPKSVASIASRMPMFLSKRMDSVDLSLFSVLATASLVEEHRNQLKELSNLVNRIVVISRWLYDALRINEVPEEKLVLCQTGGPTNGHTDVIKSTSSSLRLGFLGRWTKDKGLHVLIRALKQLPPEVPIQLDVYALGGGDGAAEYEADVRRSASKDPRISFKDPVDRADIFKTLQTFDLLAIPSQCMETGPLVALEAHAAGVPIIASDLGGLSERVCHETDGLLVPSDNVEAWTKVLLRVAEDRRLVYKLRNGIKPIRTMSNVASDMKRVYDQLLVDNSDIGAATYMLPIHNQGNASPESGNGFR